MWRTSVPLMLAAFCSGARADYGTDQTGYAAAGRYDLIERQLEPMLAKGPLRTRDQHALCLAYAKLKRYDRLLPCLDRLQALVDKGDRRTRIFGLDDATPAIHLMRAEALTDMGDYAGARQSANEALIWLRREGSGDHDMVVNAYAAVAVAVALQGDGTLARQTVELLKGFKVDGDYKRAKAMALARANMAIGAWADVINVLESSEASFQFDKMLDNFLSGAAFAGRNNWVWIELPRAFMLHKAQLEVGRLELARAGFDRLLSMPELSVNAEVYWQVLVERARIAERDAQWDKAMDLYRRARDVIESQRRSVRTETSKIGFTNDKQSVYHGIVRVALKLGNKVLAVEMAEQAKSRTLVDILASKSDFGSDSADVSEIGAAFSEFNRLDGELAIQLPEFSPGRRTDLLVLRQQALLRLKSLAPQLASLVSAGGAGIAQMGAGLGGNETLVGFFGVGPVLYGYTVAGAEVRVHQLDGNGLDADVSEFRQSIKKRRKQTRELAEQLYRRLLAPMQGSLAGRDLLIVPHGSLHYLPFAALHDGQRYLVQGRALRYLPTAMLLGLLPSAKSAAGGSREQVVRLLILGNPDLGQAALDLPAAQEEAQALQAMFAKNSELLVRQFATETVLKQRAVEFSHVHVASHGEFSADAPLTSRLRLAADGANDGVLTVSEIYGLRLKADHVMLSACETGLGQVSNGDDVVGLTRGFLYAGARNVTGSLWEVDDDATAELAKRLYQNLRNGVPVSRALAQAQESVLAKKPHPYFWAAFTLNGAGR
ncbi:CHAT domain-containing protein [Rhodoferax sp.]|uniref:CHAT domain-containing protein n=1 Tax=Rhodoferax sp. TaxID=50421 RepID=UPI002763D982|nr:CHAT domain-containing protein [Rhodoferax sp.]